MVHLKDEAVRAITNGDLGCSLSRQKLRAGPHTFESQAEGLVIKDGGGVIKGRAQVGGFHSKWP